MIKSINHLGPKLKLVNTRSSQSKSPLKFILQPLKEQVEDSSDYLSQNRGSKAEKITRVNGASYRSYSESPAKRTARAEGKNKASKSDQFSENSRKSREIMKQCDDFKLDQLKNDHKRNLAIDLAAE